MQVNTWTQVNFSKVYSSTIDPSLLLALQARSSQVWLGSEKGFQDIWNPNVNTTTGREVSNRIHSQLYNSVHQYV